jgi:hypothetical protein
MSAYFALHIHLIAGLCFLAIGIAFCLCVLAILRCAKCNWLQSKLHTVADRKSERNSEIRISIVEMDIEYKQYLYYLYQNSYGRFKEMRANDVIEFGN